MQEQAQATIYISIHALLAESDDDFFACGLNPKHFYPRSPCGERHPMTGDPRFQFLISIHALLAESDSVRRKPKALLGNFYPRSPCGERPTRKRAPAYSAKFLSTLSLRRATYAQARACIFCKISIHALLAESDMMRHGARCTSSIFLSTLSLRRATLEHIKTLWRSVFLSTLSLRRATRKSCNEL